MRNTTRAIRIHETGAPEVMRWEEISLPEPGSGEVQLRHTAVGLNFIDINHRSGAYPLKSLPAVIGMEGAGIIEAVGDGVVDFVEGDRVAYCMVLGAYAEHRIIAADRLIPIGLETTDEVAAAATLQGLTAHYLVHESWPVRDGDTVLVHAAAGGVGLLLCQWAKAKGATVIGTVGSDEKAAYVANYGCDYPVVYTNKDFAKKVLELTDQRGADVIYDAVGHDTFEKGIGCLAERGRMVSYGQSSGAVSSVSLAGLRARSASVACGGLGTFVQDSIERDRNAAVLFRLIEDGTLRLEINQRYPLSEAVVAHTELAQRRTTGSSIFIV